MNRHHPSPTHALLGLLSSGERHGYELKHIVDQEFAPYWRIDFAQLYRSLATMSREGWVKSRRQPGAGAPDRKVYSLTALGRKVLSEWLAEPAQESDEFFVKLRLAHTGGAPVVSLLNGQRRALEQERDARLEMQRIAKDSGDAARLALANAALRETEAMLVTLDLSTALVSAKPGPSLPTSIRDQLTIAGSDDPLLSYLANLVRASTRVVGSVGGLLALAERHADLAGVHLLDAASGEYNVPFVRHLVPETETVLVNLAFRENGLMIAPGNPKSIRGLRDLTRADVRFINRQHGAGTRLLLYSKLRAARIDPHSLKGWESAVSTHDAVADAIVTGAVDAGPGLRAVAYAWGLDFIPLGEERYDLVIPRDLLKTARIQSVMDALESPSFRRAASSLRGYDLTRIGQVVARVRT